eukprot:CAMPEP_0198283614 /NCGR_PEP_ID=MMETSP1449-20131203/3188_1 /TAXON_ID=420275 /ORGANISM="Attheya septentrionalis, Strain CCMP2084" /LENGTH=698 /DNA_ID=CAMNT_0043980311 /DNA_START=191 /DNA_END=2287 /DNA_ORIENTATION=-
MVVEVMQSSHVLTIRRKNEIGPELKGFEPATYDKKGDGNLTKSMNSTETHNTNGASAEVAKNTDLGWDEASPFETCFVFENECIFPNFCFGFSSAPSMEIRQDREDEQNANNEETEEAREPHLEEEIIVSDEFTNTGGEDVSEIMPLPIESQENDVKNDAARTSHPSEPKKGIFLSNFFMTAEQQEFEDKPVQVIVNESNKLSLVDNLEPIQESDLTDDGNLAVEFEVAIDLYGQYHPSGADVLCRIGRNQSDRGETDSALNTYREAQSIYCAALGDHDMRTLDTRTAIAHLLLKLGELNEGIGLLYQVLYMKKAILGDQHTDVCDLLEELSRLLHEDGKVAASLKELKNCLKVYRDKQGDKNPKVAGMIEQVALMYMELKEYGKAKSIMIEVVKLRKAVSGEEHSDVARAFLGLGSCYKELGNETNALNCLKKAYFIYVKNEGFESIGTADALDTIGQVYLLMNQEEKATKALTRVIGMRKKVFGNNSPEVADSFLSLGIALKECLAYEKAMKCFQRAITIYVILDRGMDDAIPLSNILYEIFLTHRACGELDNALQLSSQILTLRKQTLGNNHLENAALLRSTGNIESERKNYKQAMSFLMRALRIYEDAPDQDKNVAATLVDSASVLESSGKKDEAREVYLEAFVIYKGAGLKDEDPSVAHIIVQTKALGLQCECTQEKCESFPCKSLDPKKGLI